MSSSVEEQQQRTEDLRSLIQEASSMPVFRTFVKNARQLVQVVSRGEKLVAGKEAMNQLAIIPNGSMIIDLEGKILRVGPHEEILADLGPDFEEEKVFETILDATGKVVLPGFCDSHTHPVWSGDRVHEFAAKLAGATYMDIHKMGGGIGFTVQHTTASTEDELLESFQERLDRMLAQGTTLLEGKSGYGLLYETELKMLKVLHRANQVHPIDIVSNYCGAHSVPKGSTAAEATKRIIEEDLPKLIAAKERGEIDPTLIDVFCEKGVFETEDTRKILEAGKKYGLGLNFHGDELHPMESGEPSADLDALAVSHLECISEEGIRRMAEKSVIGVLLPTTAYILRIQPPPARRMIDSGIPVALGSDFNPNAHSLSMPFVMNLACVTMHMTLPEVLIASTINSAASMAKSSTHGSLEPGKFGDFVVLEAPTWEHVVYQLVDPPIQSVWKNGKLAHQTRK